MSAECVLIYSQVAAAAWACLRVQVHNPCGPLALCSTLTYMEGLRRPLPVSAHRHQTLCRQLWVSHQQAERASCIDTGKQEEGFHLLFASACLTHCCCLQDSCWPDQSPRSLKCQVVQQGPTSGVRLVPTPDKVTILQPAEASIVNSSTVASTGSSRAAPTP